MESVSEKSISLLGSGWLGKPLALQLLKEGYKVKASTTSVEKLGVLKDSGIEPFLIELDPDTDPANINGFLDSEILFINIPPGTRKNPGSDFHLRQMQFLLENLKGTSVKKIIYVSSTSVYPNLNRQITEEDVVTPAEAGNRVLAEAEQMVKESGFPYCIMRMGGLTGYDRLLVKYFSGKKGLPGGNVPINMIHRDDCLSIIDTFLKKGKWNTVYNCCSPVHPVKKEFYTFLAKEKGYPLPVFDEDDKSDWKEVSPQKLITDLDYKFIFPDPFDYTY